MISTTANPVRSANDAASATRRPCCSRSSAGPISGAITANGAIVINRYSATLSLLSPVAAAKNSVLASATAIAASVAKLATTGQVSAVSPDLSAPSAVAARCTIEYIREPISRLRWAAARVTVTRSPLPEPPRGGSLRGGVPGSRFSGGRYRLELGIGARCDDAECAARGGGGAPSGGRCDRRGSGSAAGGVAQPGGAAPR